jgi:peptidyl-prolyl cis-trans isomerase D
MISWIQRYFQHHFKVVFAVLLFMMAIPLIWVFNPSSGINRGDRRSLDRPFFGYNLNLQEDQQRLMGDAGLSANLQLGSFGGLEAEQIQNYAFQRAATLHLADAWHIPASTPTEIADMIKTLRIFAGQDGQFDAKAYATFRDNLKTNPRGVTEGDIARVIAADVRAKKVQDLLAGPGYVLPGDVKNQLARADTSWTLATATADYTSFAPAIKPTDADLAKFFDENSFRYEIPPRVTASYIEFSSLNFIAGVIVTDAEVRAFYDANPARFPKPPEAKPAAPAKPDAPSEALAKEGDYAAARAQVEGTLKFERAQQLAMKAASDVAVAIYEGKLARNVPGPALDAFLAARKLSLKTLAPFTREAGPVELGASSEVAAEAFKLGKDHDRYISEALPAATGAVILVWKNLEAARKPLLAEVREKVSADYVENERRKRFVELGKTLKARLEARLKAGDTFEKAVAAAGDNGVKLAAKTIPAFTLRNRPQDLDYSVLGMLERLEKGQVSDMVINADKGLFVFAADKAVPDLSEANPQFVATRAQLAGYNARLGGSAYVADLVEKELKSSEPKEP